MPQPRRAQRWLALGATSLALALMLLFAGMPLIAPYGDGIVVAQGDDDDDNSNDNSAPTSPSMPAAPMPSPSPSPGTGSGTSTQSSPGTGTSSGTGTTTTTNQAGCVQPAANVTERRMFNLYAPSCLGPSR